MSGELIRVGVTTPVLSEEVLRRPPAVVERSGRDAAEAWLDFFTAALANDNTRAAYKRGLHEFFHFVALKPDATVASVTARMVAAWREWLTKGPLLEPTPSGRTVERKRAIATVKLKMAAVRSFFAYLKERGVLDEDPAAGVKAPRLSVEIGKTLVLQGEDAPKILDTINARIRAAITNGEAPLLVDLRDRAFIGVMTFAVARVSATINLKIGDLHLHTRPRKVRLFEKGSKEHVVALHHELEAYLVEYLAALRGAGEPVGTDDWLFRAFDRASKEITTNPLDRVAAWRIVDRRAKDAGFNRFEGRRPRGAGVTSHTFRGTGITSFLNNGGHIERARKLAGHVSIRTTQLYDHTNKAVTMDDVVLIDLRRRKAAN
jgi:integrase/recombinase XerD